MKKVVVILTIVFFMFGIFSIYTRVNAENENSEEIKWLDFSNATFKIEEEDNIGQFKEYKYNIYNINNVDETESYSLLFQVTNNTEKPSFTRENDIDDYLNSKWKVCSLNKSERKIEFNNDKIRRIFRTKSRFVFMDCSI